MIVRPINIRRKELSKRAVSGITLTLLLIGVLTLAFNIQLVKTKELMKPIKLSKGQEYFGESMVTANPDDQFSVTRETVEEGYSIYATPDEKNWDFNRVNEWMELAKVHNDSLELIIGVSDSRPDRYDELKRVIIRNNGEIVDIVSIEEEIVAAVVDMPLMAVSSFIAEIQTAKLSKYVEPNLKFQVDFVPNDPYWSYQWGPRRIEANSAWDTQVGNSSVLVAVLDTGIDWDHPDLAANYVALGYDWVNNDTNPMDDHGHGTHCAGIIAAVLNNSIGIAGLAQIQIMAEKVLDQYGIGYTDDVAKAIVHAVGQGADIISMSFGGDSPCSLAHQALKYAYDHGVLLVAAAGNEETNRKHYPAAYDEVIAVAATDINDDRASWSNYGNWVELAAPGVDIYSTVWNDSYTSKSGTSMACPHIAGVAALIWSQFPKKTRDWVRIWLRYTADDLGDSGFDVYYGYGRVNARKGVEQPLPDHDLCILNWMKPQYVEPGSVGIINTTILNFGKSNESDIMVQLLVNNSMVDSASIDFLASDTSTTISCLWNPIVEGAYNVTSYVVPMPNETIAENNVAWAYIYVGFPVKALLLRSGGVFKSETWDILNMNWPEFGSTIIEIDCTYLGKYDITYEDLAAAGTDVLIISYVLFWEYTDQEIHAIMRYVYEGHGLIVTSGTFDQWVPNNNKLARLLGLNETTTWHAYRTYSKLLDLLDPTHPLFVKIPNPYYMRERSTAAPSDLEWDSNELMGGTYVALGGSKESAIVVHNGLVYISPHVESLSEKNDLQLLYNAITWSRYEKPEHELVTFLEAPINVQPGDSTTLKATVFNAGLDNESDVELQLLINDVTVDSVLNPELTSGSFHTISYSWTPTVEATYNITAYVSPAPSDGNPLNNNATTLVVATYPLIHPIEGQWANYIGYRFDENHEIIGAIEQNFTYTQYVSPYQINITENSKDPWSSERTDRWIVNILNRWIERCSSGHRGSYPYWIETNVTLGSTVNFLKYTATVVDTQFVEVGARFIECWRLNCIWEFVEYGDPYKLQWDLWYDKSSGLLIKEDYVQFTRNSLVHGSRLTLVTTNVPIGNKHDLTVTSSPIAGITFTINDTQQTTPYTEWLLEGSYTLQMPETHNGYVWSHWLEDGDPNRTKKITLPGTTWTGVFEFAVQPAIPVGGYSIPINGYTAEKPLTLYLALTAILAASFTMIRRKTHKRTKRPLEKSRSVCSQGSCSNLIRKMGFAGDVSNSVAKNLFLHS